MQDRLIQALWIGNNLSNIELLSIKSFLANGHRFVLYSYNSINNIPNGVIVKNAAEILPFDKNYRTKEGSYAPFADKFRVNLIYKVGGWWVDLDVVCIKNFNVLPQNCIACSFERKDGDHANTNAFCFQKGHPFLKHCMNIWDNIGYESLYHGLGPDIFKKAIADLNMQNVLMPHEVFNPISYYHTKYIFMVPYITWPIYNIYKLMKRDFCIEYPSSKTHAIHLWNEMLRSNNIDKNGKFNYYSLIEILKRKYLYT